MEGKKYEETKCDKRKNVKMAKKLYKFEEMNISVRSLKGREK